MKFGSLLFKIFTSKQKLTTLIIGYNTSFNSQIGKILVKNCPMILKLWQEVNLKKVYKGREGE